MIFFSLLPRFSFTSNISDSTSTIGIFLEGILDEIEAPQHHLNLTFNSKIDHQEIGIKCKTDKDDSTKTMKICMITWQLIEK